MSSPPAASAASTASVRSDRRVTSHSTKTDSVSLSVSSSSQVGFASSFGGFADLGDDRLGTVLREAARDHLIGPRTAAGNDRRFAIEKCHDTYTVANRGGERT
ncbi:hypothetical protein [Natronomonas sp.]|uniref:hypothetical protein n=1 Tax=Natronomonas sp. TaxID=2184060 RepID=UPI0039757FBE